MKINRKNEKAGLSKVSDKNCDNKKKNAAKVKEIKPINTTNLPETVDLLFFKLFTP